MFDQKVPVEVAVVPVTELEGLTGSKVKEPECDSIAGPKGPQRVCHDLICRI